MKWNDKPQVKKGNLGEGIIDKYFENQGYITYKPVTDGAHLIDRLYVKDKKQLIFADVKTKPKRNKYPDTGFNYKNYEEYEMLKEMGLEVWIIFVDEAEGAIYGNTLEKLSEPCSIQHKGKTIEYPLRWGEIIYFYRNDMIDITLLSKEEVGEIRSYNTRNYEYEVHG